MNVLLLAPQPFYAERGTPIAVRLAATALVRLGHRVDLLCYHEGEAVALEGLRVHRIRPPAFVRNVPIGFSWKKVVCDAALARAAHRLLHMGRYDVVHAVEEAVFIALAAQRRRGFAVVYDMDSLMAEQLAHKWRWLRPFQRPLERFEAFAARRADRVLAVCPALAAFARASGAGDRVHLLPDVAFPVPHDVLPAATAAVDDLRALFDRARPLVLYVGNLERYQGIDLLLEAMRFAPGCNLAVVGGSAAGQTHYRAQVRALGIEERVRFAGARPLAQLPSLLGQADILCSPRRAGANTPMKLYSYLAAGRAIVATAIEAHTQVLDERCARLVPVAAQPLGAALQSLADDPAQRAVLAGAARRAADAYGFDAFERRLAAAYQGLGGRQRECERPGAVDLGTEAAPRPLRNNTAGRSP